MNKSKFNTKTLEAFKKKVIHMNRNRKCVVHKSKEVERREKMKHE